MKSLTIITLLILTTSCAVYKKHSTSRGLANSEENVCTIKPLQKRFLAKGIKVLKEEISHETLNSAEECYKKALNSIEHDLVKVNIEIDYGFQKLKQKILVQEHREWTFNNQRGVLSKLSPTDFDTGYRVSRPTCYHAPAYYYNEDKQYTDETNVEYAYVDNWRECYTIALNRAIQNESKEMKRFLNRGFPNPSFKYLNAKKSVAWGYRALGILNDRHGFVDKSSPPNQPEAGDLRKK